VVVGGTSFTGGIGTMPGTLIGTVIIGILDKGLNQAGVHFSLQYIVKGLVILAAVYLDVQRPGHGTFQLTALGGAGSLNAKHWQQPGPPS